MAWLPTITHSDRLGTRAVYPSRAIAAIVPNVNSSNSNRMISIGADKCRHDCRSRKLRRASHWTARCSAYSIAPIRLR